MVALAGPNAPTQSDQLIPTGTTTGTDFSPATSLSLSIYNLLLYVWNTKKCSRFQNAGKSSFIEN